jgi:type I restriction-modification system DNA methylase subunit
MQAADDMGKGLGDDPADHQAALGLEPAHTFARDQFPDLKFDYIFANPPFNICDWG